MKKIILSFFLFYSLFIPSKAQNTPEPTITEGHSGNLSAMIFNTKGTFMATAAADHKVKIWDLQLNKEYRTFLHFKDILSLKFSNDGNYLAVQETGNSLCVWDIQTGNQLISFNESSSIKNTYFFLNNALFAYQKTNKAVDLYNLQTGIRTETITTIKGTLGFLSESRIITLPNSSDGDYYTTIIDRASGQKLASIVEGITFSPKPPTIDELGTRLVQDNNGTLEVYDLTTYTKTTTLSIPQFSYGISALSFSKDGKQLVLSKDDFLAMIDCVTGKIMYNYTVKDNSINTYQDPIHIEDIAINPNNKTVAFVSSGMSTITIHLIDGPSGLFQYKYTFPGQPTKLFFKHIAVSNNQKTCSVVNNNSLKLWNIEGAELLYSADYVQHADLSNELLAFTYANSGIYKDLLYFVNTVDMSIQAKLEIPAIRFLTLSGNGKYACTVSYNGKVVCMYETTTGKILQQKTFSETILKCALDYEGANLVFLSSENPKNITVYTPSADKVIQWPIGKGNISELNFSKGTSDVLTLGFYLDKQIGVYDHINRKEKASFSIPGYPTGTNTNLQGTMIATSVVESSNHKVDFPILVYDIGTKKLLTKITGQNARLVELKWGSDGKTIYSIDEVGFSKIRSMDTPSNEVTMIGTTPTSYMMLTKDNYYKSPKSTFSFLAFRYNGKLYEYDQFDYLLNRPDKVLKALAPICDTSLASMYYLAYTKRVRQQNLHENQDLKSLEAPLVNIVDKQNIPMVTSSNLLSIKLSIKDQTFPLSSLKIYINNVPIFGKRGMNLSSSNSKELIKELTLALSGGKNHVEISATNSKGYESLNESFTIEAPKNHDRELFVLAIGVSNFKIAEQNLLYAAKDVNDFTTTLQQSSKFKKVTCIKLIDSMATTQGIINAFQSLQKTHPDDAVVIYFSTHGTLNKEYNFYLGTYDINLYAPEVKGLSYETLLECLDKVPARSRLILLDACASGELDKEDVLELETTSIASYDGSKSGVLVVKKQPNSTDAFDYMKELFANLTKNTGCVVVSASGAFQKAIETKQFNNSVFTYVLKDGLTTKQADLNKDGNISVSELTSYTSSKVPGLTKQKQKPALRDDNELVDFILY